MIRRKTTDVLTSKITCKNVHTSNGYRHTFLIYRKYSVYRGQFHSLSSPARTYWYKDGTKTTYWVINNRTLYEETNKMITLNGIL
jgi:hypothetical protein